MSKKKKRNLHKKQKPLTLHILDDGSKDIAKEYCLLAIKISENNPEQALALFEMAIISNPQYEHAYHNRGFLKYKMKNYNEAIIDFDKAIELKNDFRLSIYFRGCCKRLLKDHKDALKAFDKAIELEPNNHDGYWSRGRTKLDMGLYKEALNDYNIAVKLSPKYNIDLFTDRAVAYDHLGFHKEAIEDYKKCIEINSKCHYAYTNLGVAYSMYGNWKKAHENFCIAIKIKPDFCEAIMNRGINYLQQNNYEEALKDFNKSIEINPNLEMVYINRAEAFYELENYASALKDLNIAEKYDCNQSLIYFIRAKTAAQQNNLNDKIYNLKLFFCNQLKRCNLLNVNKINLNLYRPIDSYTIDAIKENYIWFSHPDDFNDPLESSYYESDENDKEMKTILKDVRIRSFSQSNNHLNQLLWAHYADKFNGIIIEYEIDIHEINKKNIYISQVEYAKAIRPQGTRFEMVDSGKSYFIKYKDWKYEKEWRLITLQENLIDGHKLKEGFKIKSITFGLGSKKDDELKIIDMFPSCVFYKIKRHKNIVSGAFKIKRYKY